MHFFRKTVGKPLVVMAIILATLLSLELAGQIVWKKQNGECLFFKNNMQNEIFIEHPYLVGVPKPSVSIKSKDNYSFSHNSLGYRGKDIATQKAANIKRVVTLGGSSTYCAGVSDNATWPYFLEEYLGKDWEVINLGVPGYTTVENLIQTALNISKLSPDIALYYEGWNDLRNMPIENLKSDYSDFHGNSLYYTLQLDKPAVGKNITIVLCLQNLLRKLFYNETKREYRKVNPTATAFTPEIDQDALFLYRRNLKSIIVLCNSLNITPVMIPQVLNCYKLLKFRTLEWVKSG